MMMMMMMMMIIWGGKGNGPLLGLCLFAIDLLKMSFWGLLGPRLAFDIFWALFGLWGLWVPFATF